jgi:hypothetical protein
VRLLGNFATWLAPLPGCWLPLPLCQHHASMPAGVAAAHRSHLHRCTAAPLHRNPGSRQHARACRGSLCIVRCWAWPEGPGSAGIRPLLHIQALLAAGCWQAPTSTRRVRPVFLDIYVRNELTHQHALTCQRARSSRSAEHFLGTVQTQTPTHGPEVGTAARNFQPRIQGRSLRKWLWKCT